MRWKQWLHVASAILDSDNPDQPRIANAKAVMSEGEVGGSYVVVELDAFQKLVGIRSRISEIRGPG